VDSVERQVRNGWEKNNWAPTSWQEVTHGIEVPLNNMFLILTWLIREELYRQR